MEKYLKCSDAIILVYSITNNQTFLEINDYLDGLIVAIKKLLNDSKEENEKFTIPRIVLLGNKIDLERYRYFIRAFY